MVDSAVRHSETRGVHRLLLERGANALDRPLMAALRDALRELRENGTPAVLLASAHPRVFCPGWDLKQLAGADHNEVAAFLESFNALVVELFSYPGPTAAEIGGHAVAAGCLLAACCDLRVMATGRPRLGLSELNLGVPVPAVSLRVLRSRLSAVALDELVFRAEGFSAERARELGLVHRAVAPAELEAATALEIGRLASRSRRAFAESKRFLLAEAWRDMVRVGAEEDAAFLACWFETDTQARIAEVASRLGA